MLKFLKKPYPFNADLKHNAKIIFFISAGILAFLLVFQPVEIKNFTNRQIFLIVTGIAVTTFLVLSINLIVIPSMFPKLFDNPRWNIKKEIVWNLWILLAISSSDFLFYTQLFGIIDIHFMDILKIFFLGGLPVAIIIILNQGRLLRFHLRSAQQLSNKITESKKMKEKTIFFESDYQKDNLTIKLGSLILIKSADNYIEVYFYEDSKVRKHLLRSSLIKAEALIKKYENIFKCHRTFIVNIDHISEIKGNSQGYKLYFEGLDFPALVSQKYISELNKRI